MASSSSSPPALSLLCWCCWCCLPCRNRREWVCNCVRDVYVWSKEPTLHSHTRDTYGELSLFSCTNFYQSTSSFFCSPNATFEFPESLSLAVYQKSNSSLFFCLKLWGERVSEWWRSCFSGAAPTYIHSLHFFPFRPPLSFYPVLTMMMMMMMTMMMWWSYNVSCFFPCLLLPSQQASPVLSIFQKAFSSHIHMMLEPDATILNHRSYVLELWFMTQIPSTDSWRKCGVSGILNWNSKSNRFLFESQVPSCWYFRLICFSFLYSLFSFPFDPDSTSHPPVWITEFDWRSIREHFPRFPGSVISIEDSSSMD